MQKRTLGSTGLEVSALGFGGAPIGFLEADAAQVAALLNVLLDRGVNLIDTAAMYAGSEEVIGAAIEPRRAEVVLVTKCPNPMADGDDCWGAEKIRSSVERSLRRLRTSRVDVVLLHSCGLDVLQRGEALAALLRLRDEGKIRFAGYSGDNETAVYAAGLPGISVIETSVSLCDQANLKGVLVTARQRGLGVIAKRPLANSAWKPLGEQQGMYASYAKTYTERFQAMGLSLADLGLTGNPLAIWPQVALRFTLAQPGVQAAIVGTCHLAHAEANLSAAALGPLPEAVLATLRAAFAKAEAASGEAWTAQT